MARDNTIVLSDEEKALVEEVKQAQYGDETLPHGFVIGDALRQVLHKTRATGTSTESPVKN
jgi:hypothetical protein